MQFLRENLFLLILIAVVVVLGGTLTVMNFSVAADVEKRVQQRTEVSGKLKQYARGNGVNRAILDAERQRVEAVRDEANRVVSREIEHNREANPILKVPVIFQQKVIRIIAAFPIDPKEYNDFGLAQTFMDRHRQETSRSLQLLQTTGPPTELDILREIPHQETVLRKKGLAASRPAEEAAPPSGTRYPPGTAYPPEMTYAPRTPPSAEPRVSGAASLTGEATLQDKAKVQAFDYCVYSRATAGRVYLDPNVSQEISFGAGQTQADEASLWRKQYKLWIAGQVVDAVRKTNEQVLGKLPEGERNVTNAAVKRWMSLRIDDGYFLESVSGPPSGGMPSYVPEQPYAPPQQTSPPGYPSPTGPPGYPTPPYGEYGPRGGYGAYPYRPTATPSPAPTAVQISTGDEKVSPTKRYTNPEADVVHYTFSVIMPSRHLQRLIDNLQAGRMHTVLKTEWTQPPSDAAEKLYYYGNDSVMVVTLICEAQFLTAWSRDLTPVSFLKTLPDSVLREADRKRLAPPAPGMQP